MRTKAHPAQGHDRLAGVLFGKSMRSILALLYGNPDRRYFMREIARAADVPPSSLQRELAALAAGGALTRIEEGRQVYYRANRACPIFEELKSIAAKTFGVAGALKAQLAPHADRIRLAFVYGSIAKGDAAAASDIDLLWVGDLSPSEAVFALAEAERRLGRKISVIAYSVDEFAGMLVQGDHFLSAVLEGPLLWLFGNREALDELRQAQPRKPRARKAAQRRGGGGRTDRPPAGKRRGATA